MYTAVLPYLGPEAALEELHTPPPGPAGTGKPVRFQSPVPFRHVSTRGSDGKEVPWPELGPLPGGHHGLSPEQVAESQHERLLSAVAHVVADRGYRATTITEIVKTASVSTRISTSTSPQRRSASSLHLMPSLPTSKSCSPLLSSRSPTGRTGRSPRSALPCDSLLPSPTWRAFVCSSPSPRLLRSPPASVKPCSSAFLFLKLDGPSAPMARVCPSPPRTPCLAASSRSPRARSSPDRSRSRPSFPISSSSACRLTSAPSRLRSWLSKRPPRLPPSSGLSAARRQKTGLSGKRTISPNKASCLFHQTVLLLKSPAHLASTGLQDIASLTGPQGRLAEGLARQENWQVSALTSETGIGSGRIGCAALLGLPPNRQSSLSLATAPMEQGKCNHGPWGFPVSRLGCLTAAPPPRPGPLEPAPMAREPGFLHLTSRPRLLPPLLAGLAPSPSSQGAPRTQHTFQASSSTLRPYPPRPVPASASLSSQTDLVGLFTRSSPTKAGRATPAGVTKGDM